MADVQIKALGTSAAPLSYTVPGAQEIVLKSLYASFDGSAAVSGWYPGIRILAPGGGVVGEYKALESVVAGGSADASFAPFLRAPQVAQAEFIFNVAELGFTGSGAQATTYTHTVQFNQMTAADAIFVSVQAPSVPAAATGPFYPLDVTDSQGNTYLNISQHLWEAAPPNTNEGAAQFFFIAYPPVVPLTVGVDTITATWSGSVFDRSIYAWLLRHDAGPEGPTRLDSTADNNAAVFASTQVTLTSPAFTADRDNTLAFSTIFSAKAGGTGAFGGVIGYSGYLQIQSRAFTGSKQIYRINIATYGANALEVNPFGGVPYEIDLGQIPNGTFTAAFNGVAQNYSLGANAWKGIVIWQIA